MNDGWLNAGADYVILIIGFDETLGLVLERYCDDRAVVQVMPDGEPVTYTVSWPVRNLRAAATPLEIYEHGEQRLRTQPVGPGYGSDAGKTMWELMSQRDRAYWRGLRPTDTGQLPADRERSL